MTGPIANPSAGVTFNNQALTLTGVLLLIQSLGLFPFVFLRKRVTTWMIVLFWIFFVVSEGAWYFGALLS